MKPAQIELHIEELILRDLPYAQRYHIAAAVEQNLAQLLVEQGLPPSLTTGAHIPLISIASIHMTADARPDSIGTQIAQQIYSSLSGEPVVNNG